MLSTFYFFAIVADAPGLVIIGFIFMFGWLMIGILVGLLQYHLDQDTQLVSENHSC